MKLEMLNNKVLVSIKQKQTKTKSGIILPEEKNERIVMCKVEAVPVNIDVPITKGDFIYVDKYKLTECEIDGKRFIVDADDILAVVDIA